MDDARPIARIVFMPSGRRGDVPIGTPVLEAARQLGVDIDSVCGGRGLCGRCQVTLIETAGADARIEELSERENRLAERRVLRTGSRLSCTTLINDNLVVEVPAASQVHRQLVRKGVEAHDIELNPSIRPYLVAVDEPNMHDPRGDLQRVVEALKTQWGLDSLRCEPVVLNRMQDCLREGNWRVTVAVRTGSTDTAIVAVWPGLKTRITGLAIDIGSTTIAAQLCDLGSGDVLASDGIMNPQIRFGEDLMSRVSWAMMHPDRWHEMTDAVRAAINELIESVCLQAGVDPFDLVDATVVANPIMHHLFLGINPISLGSAPFALVTDASVTVSATAVALKMNPGASVYVLPCVAGHVGADTAGVILAERPDQGEPLTLLVDVGTNAEIVLGNCHRLVACSSPTGPAFEGAQISAGQRAAPGAVERIRIDPVTLAPRFQVIGSALWSDEAGFAKSVAGTGISGICGSGIIEAVSQMFLAGILRRDGVINGTQLPNSPHIVEDGRTFSYRLHANGDHDLLITQNDVRAIQLAKAALYAGIKLLMARLGVDRVDRIRLAGAFGSHIDVVQAMVLGMLPDCPIEAVGAAGNAAGTGARIALLDAASRTEIESIVQRVEKIETAVEPAFQEHFVNAMAIPHAVDDYPNLRRAIPLIELPAAGISPSPTRRRRRSQRTPKAFDVKPD